MPAIYSSEPPAIRFAQFNASLNRRAEGQLVNDLANPDANTPGTAQAKTVAEIIQRDHPDVVQVEEFDYFAADPASAVELFLKNYLNVSQNGAEPIDYPYFYIAPSNTGTPSGFDLDNNGVIASSPDQPGYGNDSFGFGNYPGQFGMLLLSKYPIDLPNVRTFQTFLWQDMPDSLLPTIQTPGASEPWYSPEEQAALRLSSKSHWDVPIQIDGKTIHALVSHPTPPTFDGAEDRNGKRNYDEIRFWSDYVTPGKGGYIYDDQGRIGQLAADSSFVIMGDQNADPKDGDSYQNAILQLLDNPLTNTSVTPASAGGVDAALRQGRANLQQTGNPAFDTADFNDNAPGNLRTDYVLPSKDLKITGAEVFWPTPADPLFRLAGDFDASFPPEGFPASDHRLVWVDVMPTVDVSRKSVSTIEFLGEVTLPTGIIFQDTEVGGLSGITYDASQQVYYSISDDRSEKNPARFYTLNIDLSDGTLDSGDVQFQAVTTLKNAEQQPFASRSLDPEGITLVDRKLYISSEGDANQLINPFVNQFGLDGQQLAELPVDAKFLPTADRTSGIRNNLAFESLTVTPDQRYLYAATENALYQDGSAATLENESPSRIIRYNLQTGEVDKEILYLTDAVPNAPVPATGFSTNGLVDLFALDNNGNLLALERAFSDGVGNTIKLYQVSLQNTTDLQDIDALGDLEVDAVAEKTLLLDFSTLGLPLDNIEGLTFGPTLPDGRQSLVVVSDNNFSSSQFTQVLAFALDLQTTLAVAPITETPSLDRLETDADADDPAIYVNPLDSGKSLVITALKDGGLAVYDLDGQEVQRIAPDDIRFNNVDLVYGFMLGGKKVDLAVASDRRNDTLAIWSIDPATQRLTNITASSLSDPSASIFGVDDGAQSAYGLATYTSPVNGKSYAFVSERDADRIAQLEIIDNGQGQVDAKIVRTLTVPIPAGGELEDAQVEGMVADRELGYLYAAQENVGIWKFQAEPNADVTGRLIEPVKPEGDVITADAEGLTIYYGENGSGYLLASSQGDSSYAAFSREGNNDYLGSFIIDDGIDGVEESDGADVTSVALGTQFPNGLLVVHDGSNEPAQVVVDDGEVQNYSTNFKFVPWDSVAKTFTPALTIGSDYDPRQPQPNSLLGVASGDTNQTSTVLWAQSSILGTVNFEYSIFPGFEYIFGYNRATVTDPNLPVKLGFSGLTPGQTYYYRATDAAGATATGQFKTSNAIETQAGFQFGVTGDWRGELSPYPAIANADERDLELFIELGDTIYSDFESPILPGVQQAETLDEFRLKHKEVYDSRFGLNTWNDLRKAVSVLSMIDDHEVVNDFEGGEDLATASAADQALFGATSGLVNDSPLYNNGLQAFQDYNPIQDQFYGETGDNRTAGERKLYRYNTYGSDAATFLLDARSFRDAELPAVTDLSDPTQVGTFLTRSFDPSRTLLGKQQLSDLKQDLLAADQAGVTWKFVLVPEPIQNLGVLAAGDRFEGYAAERTELLKYIDDNEIDNVVFVAADVHGTLVNNLTYQTAPGQAQIATNAFEITTGSVAFDAPFGQTVAELGTQVGLVTAQQKAFYDALPVANDADSLVNDKDDFIKQLTNSGLDSLGYDPLGLNANLPQADGLINAKLLQGDYLATHTFGWTEFDIDSTTQKLTVTTYGVKNYTEAELLKDPSAITGLTPNVVSQFEVLPM